MIYKFIGGPLDGKEKDIPSEEVEKCEYVLIPVLGLSTRDFSAVSYRHGETGDLIFCPTK